jgi:hypothetical protein
MKQHITLAELQSITESQFLKLYRLIRPGKQITDKRIIHFQHSKRFGFDKLLSEINIGKMIEILSNKRWLQIETNSFTSELEVNNKYKLNSYYRSEELCDALWEAVKEVL